MNRNSSLPALREIAEEPVAVQKANLRKGGSLAPIRERSDHQVIQSADPNVSASRKMAAAAAAQ